MPRLSISLLGPKVILLDGEPAGAFTYNKAIALLAFLVVEAGLPHSRQTLVGLLWPELSNAAALTNLRQTLVDLRRVIADEKASPPFLIITRESIQFNAKSDYKLDSTTFLQLISSCEAHRHRHIDRCRLCQDRLDEAINLYRGDFLSGFSINDAAPFEEWVAIRREQFYHHAQKLLVHLVNHHQRSQAVDKAQHYLRRQLELEPWNEEAHQRLMRLYAMNGQRSKALLQFDSCRSILWAELGVEPAPLTQTLYTRIRADLPLAEEAATSQARHWQNLPLAATSFVGRVSELEQLGELISDPAHRLITIQGPGGIGKTRLALAAALEHAGIFGNGVLFVSLVGLSDVHFLPNAIIAALNAPLPDQLAPQEQLLTFLRDQELLLLLDNYEQFLPDVEFLTRLLRFAPAITVLVTSRERLAMQAEHLLELGGLEHPRTLSIGITTSTGAIEAPNAMLPDTILEQYSALNLFVQRLRQVQRNTALTTSDVAAILRIGRITEGMPLALELAAAAVRAQSCTAIANALESGQQLLSTQMRDLPERQRSLRAVFAHSMRLLSSEEYQAFCALSLFRGGFSAEAAAEVADAPLPMLVALVDKSLLRMNRTDQHPIGEITRYDMHELMRQFAERELEANGRPAQLRQRYHGYFMAMAKTANGSLAGNQPGSWIARLELDIDNLRTVLQQLRRDAPEEALKMAMDLYWLWHSRGYLQEGLDWFVDLSTNAPVSPFLLADVYRSASFFALCLNKIDQAMELVTKSLDLFRTLELTDRRNAEGYVYALTRLSFVFLFQAEYEQALAVSREAHAFAKKLDSKFHLAVALYEAGEAYTMQKRYEHARQSYQDGLILMQEIGNARAVGQSLGRLSGVAAAQGHLEEAKTLCRQALTTSGDCQDQVGLTMALLTLVTLANLEEDFQRAALLLGATETILESNPIVRTWPQDRRRREEELALLHQSFDSGLFELLWAKGRSLSLQETVSLAMAKQE